MEWRSIEGGLFSITDNGRIRRNSDGKIMKTNLNTGGYPTVCFRMNNAYKFRLVHRLVAQAFIGPCPEGIMVNHKDGNRANCNIKNLEYVTPAENSRHMVENRGKHKKYPSDVRSILIPDEIWDRVKKKAVEDDRSPSVFFRCILKTALKKKPHY